ncbi:MAG TPA: hypothetical protein VJG67_02740 [Candidatus Paceibacterota bacterium]
MEIVNIIKEPAWEIFLLNNQPSKEFEQYYKKRLRENKNSYWQTLAEAETAYLIHSKFKIPVLGFNKKTVGEKDVDLIAQLGDEEIYIEVTTSRYKNNKNTDKQQDAKLIRTLKHAGEKFLANDINLLVVYDEQLDSTFYNGFFMHDDVPATYFNCAFFEDDGGSKIDIRKISGLLLFGQRKQLDYSREHKIWKNENAYKSLSIDIELVLNTGLSW